MNSRKPVWKLLLAVLNARRPIEMCVVGPIWSRPERHGVCLIRAADCCFRIMRHEPSSGHEDATLNYRIAWTGMDSGGQRDERVFVSRNQGWDFYEDLKKSRHAYKVTWEHIPAQ